jgi:Fe2+ or Zn2+ uptake regulation protein
MDAGAPHDIPRERRTLYPVAVHGTNELIRLLRVSGYRVTRPRRAVWSVLNDAQGHLTVEEVATLVAERQPGVNLASVYRSLALFAQLNLVRESRLGDEDVTRWEVAHPDEHFHLVCDVCGRVDHHAGDLVAQVVAHLRTGHQFEPRSVELTVAGRCRECAEGRAGSSGG